MKHGDEFRSLEATDDVYTVSLERALELLGAAQAVAAQAGELAARGRCAELGGACGHAARR